MNELYKRIKGLEIKVDNKFAKIVKHYENVKTNTVHLPKWFMDDFYKKIKLLKDLDRVILSQEKDINTKVKYLRTKCLKLDVMIEQILKLSRGLHYLSDNSELSTLFEVFDEELLMSEYTLAVFENGIAPEMSNQDMALYMIDGDEKNKKYAIFSRDRQICIGEIGYSEINFGEEMKLNTFYRIFSEFRGNNYALAALNLMSEELYQSGINNLSFLINSTNVPSIKIVEKFGGIITSPKEGLVSYEANLAQIFGNEKSPIGK